LRFPEARGELDDTVLGAAAIEMRAEGTTMWIKLISVAFLAVLYLAHGGSDQLVGQPLSMFRDGDVPQLGYLMFVLLALLGALQTAALARAERVAEAGICLAATAVLVLVAVTPSTNPFHEFGSFLLLILLYGYFGCLFAGAGRLWLVVHLFSPVWLLMLTQFHSYGLWQKSYIVYVLLLTGLHNHLVSRTPADGPGREKRNPSRPRRRVYALEAGRSWSRGRPAGARASL
jgi:hypothetical protein